MKCVDWFDVSGVCVVSMLFELSYMLWLWRQIEEEERLMQELKKIEQRKKEREKKTLDLQKLITAADSNIEARRPERKTTKKAVICRVKDTNVSCNHCLVSIWIADCSIHFCLPNLNTAFSLLCLYDFLLLVVSHNFVSRDATDSASESDGIRHFFQNPKSDGYLKSDCIGFEIANC